LRQGLEAVVERARFWEEEGFVMEMMESCGAMAVLYREN
jgi:hypothetical protein